MGKGLRLEELEVYRVAMEVGEIVWNVVIKWESFEKKTLGPPISQCGRFNCFKYFRRLRKVSL